MLATMRTRPEGEGRVIEDNQYPGVRKKESESSNFGASSIYSTNIHIRRCLWLLSLPNYLNYDCVVCFSPENSLAYVGFGAFVIYRL